MFLDPRVMRRPGSRVPVNVPVWLRNSLTGRLLSASPSVSQVFQSPNSCTPSGTWEQWKLIKMSQLTPY